MPKTKEQKQAIIRTLKERLADQRAVVLVDFTGLTSEDLSKLRTQLKKARCQFQVVKKTLLEKALEALKEKRLQEKIEQIKGALALAFGFEDELTPAKICYQFSQTNEKLKILGAILDKEFLTQEKIIELAQLPSKPELLTRLVTSLKTPVSNFIELLRGNIKGLLYVLAKAKT